MTPSDISLRNHLSNDLLVRALDDELTGSEAMEVELHLAHCENCRGRQADLRRVSDGFEFFIQSLQTAPDGTGRQTLADRLNVVEPKAAVGSGRMLARFGWVLATAATVAIGVAYLPFARSSWTRTEAVSAAVSHVSQAGAPFDVDGETFVYLPYSNPDLPLGGSHVVQMQVPLSSLADAGVLVEPAASRLASPDRAVLADVLLGMDGQPIGVHILSAD